MNLQGIKEKLKSEEYDFLRTNKSLGKNIMLLTLGGSWSYGTNNKNSDIDVRGIFGESISEIIGLSEATQFEHKETDTVIYSFNKIVSLMLNCNPNTIEMFGTKDDMVFYLSDEGKLLKDNIKLFLSKRAKYTFGGYADQQLRRLENALAHDAYPEEEKTKHLIKSIENMYEHFRTHYSYFGENGFKMYRGIVPGTQEYDILVDVNLKGYPLRYYKGIQSEMNLCYRNYEKLNSRNKKKDDNHLNKHAMHLVRLQKICVDILSQGKIITYREKDLPLLLDIRNGKYQKEDKTYRKEFFELVDELNKEIAYADKHSILPEQPNFKEVEELVIEINRSLLNK